MFEPRHSSSMARNMVEKSFKPAAANLAMKAMALAMLALAYAAAPAHAQQCGAQARGRLCPNRLCCSEFGFCGATSAYCGRGCQSQCRVTVAGSTGDVAPVQAPQCGAQARGRLCPNGLCCSQYGYCGTTSAYCGAGCQSQCRVNANDTAPVQAPQCGAQARGRLCPNGLCCSQYGYCGITSAHCGQGCQSQCCVNVGGVEAVLIRELFDLMLPRHDDAACPDREFYTYDAFLAAANAFPKFGATGDEDARKREVAAFMAQAAHGPSSGDSYSGGLCYKEERGVTSDYCTPNTQFPCASNKTYHARGPIQLSYNYNYGLASQAITEDLLSNPELVATDPVVAFKTALWLWMAPGKWDQPSCHAVITGLWTATPPHQAAGRVPGFGLTTNILTGGRHCIAEDDGRVGLYKLFCDVLGVGYGANLDCRGQVPFDGEIEAPAK